MAFEFDSNGFLTHRIDALEKEISSTYEALFERARKINQDCHRLLFSADIRNRDGQAIIISTLFLRALEHYQATIILLGRGLIAGARVSLRVLVETIFKTRAIAINSGAFKEFVKEDLLQRKKLISKAQNNAYPNLEETRQAITPELLKELEQEIRSTDAKALSTEEWSKRAGMHDWYVTNYALLSKAVHTQVRELEAYLKIGKSGEIEQLRYAPSMDEIPLLILTAAHSLLIGASAFDKKFEVGFGPTGDGHNKFIEAQFRTLDTQA